MTLRLSRPERHLLKSSLERIQFQGRCFFAVPPFTFVCTGHLLHVRLFRGKEDPVQIPNAF